MLISNSLSSRDALRRVLLRQRRNLGNAQRRRAAKAIARRLERQGCFRRGARIAVYLATPFELDLSTAIARAWQRGCQVYVPIVTLARRRQMVFVRIWPNSQWVTVRWGLREPRLRQSQLTASQLDTVLAPLVGFDRHGHRLGMGAGFYDRALQGRRTRRPRLIGVAFDCQEVAVIPVAGHDVAMDTVVTETRWLQCT